MSAIKENFDFVSGKVAAAALRSGRKPEDVQLIVVTKTYGVDVVRAAVAAGAKAVGENRVQELMDKFDELGEIAQWHLIGHLQTNKVKYAVKLVNWIHSVDKFTLAEEISNRAQALGKKINVLVEVNIGEEDSKFGLQYEDAPALIREISVLPGIAVKGLMTVAPYESDQELVRPVFKKLRQLRDEVKAMNIPNISMEHLSMGMSGDYEVAIEEGATMVRVGSAIVGARNYNI